MSHDKYIRLSSQHIGEFDWTKTRDDQIVVRYKEDGEIFAVIERPLDQKCLIADSYHAGFTTGYNLRTNYIDFLEDLTAPLMPDYVEPRLPYQDEYEPVEPSGIYVTDNPADQNAENYVYDIIIPPALLEEIESINDKMSAQYPETFYAHACTIWIEDAKNLTDIAAYAVPNDGMIAKVFLNNEDHQTFQWLSLQAKHSITDLLYTAVRSMSANMKKHLNDENIVDIAEAKKLPAKEKPKKFKQRKMMTVSAANN